MELSELRRITNKRLKVYGLDKSDIDYTLLFWSLMFFSSTAMSAFILPSDIGGKVVLAAMIGIFPMAFVVKKLKSGKEKGHLEYLSYSFKHLREGKKNNKIFIYNLKRSGFLYKTLFYVTKKK